MLNYVRTSVAGWALRIVVGSLLVILVSISPAAGAAAAAEGTLMVNGDFEAGAEGWKVPAERIVEENPHGGKQCLRLGRVGDRGGRARQFIMLPPDKWYVCEFYYRSTGNPGHSRLRFMSENAIDGKRKIQSQCYDFDRTNMEKWSKGSMHIYSGGGDECEIEVNCCLRPNVGDEALDPNGVLWLDDFVLRPMEPADLKGEQIENGGFETGQVGFLPPGWSRGYVKKQGMPKVSLTDKQSHSGTRSLEIAMGAPRDVAGLEAYVTPSGTLRLEPGKQYRLSFWAKGSKETTAYFTGQGPRAFGYKFTTSPEWQRYTYDLAVTAEQEKAPRTSAHAILSFAGSLKLGNVTIWLDDVSLQQVEEK